ncbi:MAG: hypothetical protein LBO69_02315 [Ignavibacteria bacterium]|jgi:hypothetical protein|nr:hypothetical protein [Ignavibacteria bacterium]
MDVRKLIILCISLLLLLSGILYGGDKLYSVDIEQQITNGFQTPINLTVLNTKGDEFAPYYNRLTKEIIFNSTVNGYSEYYVARIDTFGYITHSLLLRSPLNEKGQNRAYFTLIDEKHALVGAFRHTDCGSIMNIHKVSYQRNTWSAPIEVPEFVEACFSSHPTISPNGSVLVFSTTKGSVNKTADLWYATLQLDGIWNMQMPLDELNSIGNEITPFFVTDNLLIFASDGFEGKGGYDLYYSFFEYGKWSKPYPIESVNTEYDETDPAMLADGTLIFASDRAGSIGGLDIYSASLQQVQIPEEQKAIPFIVNATSFSLSISRNLSYDIVYNSTINSDSSFTISPAAIQFTIEKDDNYFIDIPEIQFNYTLLCNDKNIATNALLPHQFDFVVDFTQYASEIFAADSVAILVSLENLQKKVIIDVAKDEQRELYRHNNANGNYYKIVTEYSDNLEQYKNENAPKLNKINELMLYSTHTIVLIPNADVAFQHKIKDMLNNNSTLTFQVGTNDCIEYQIYLP